MTLLIAGPHRSGAAHALSCAAALKAEPHLALKNQAAGAPVCMCFSLFFFASRFPSLARKGGRMSLSNCERWTKQRAHLRVVLGLMQSGKMSTGEGPGTDTTAISIDHVTARIAELDGLLAQAEAAKTQRRLVRPAAS